MTLLSIISKFIAAYKKLISKFTVDKEAEILLLVQELSDNMIQDIITSAPSIVEDSLKELSKKYLDLPLKYNKQVMEDIYSQYSIFKGYNPGDFGKSDITRMKNIILQGKYNNLTDQEIRDQLLKNVDITKKKALLIARSETQSIESSAKHIYFRNPEVADKYELVWVSKTDSEVRPAHERMVCLHHQIGVEYQVLKVFHLQNTTIVDVT
jgi:hypothetical protein